MRGRSQRSRLSTVVNGLKALRWIEVEAFLLVREVEARTDNRHASYRPVREKARSRSPQSPGRRRTASAPMNRRRARDRGRPRALGESRRGSAAFLAASRSAASFAASSCHSRDVGEQVVDRGAATVRRSCGRASRAPADVAHPFTGLRVGGARDQVGGPLLILERQRLLDRLVASLPALIELTQELRGDSRLLGEAGAEEQQVHDRVDVPLRNPRGERLALPSSQSGHRAGRWAGGSPMSDPAAVPEPLDDRSGLRPGDRANCGDLARRDSRPGACEKVNGGAQSMPTARGASRSGFQTTEESDKKRWGPRGPRQAGLRTGPDGSELELESELHRDGCRP